MHSLSKAVPSAANAVSAWVLEAHDALAEAAEREVGLDPRELAALTLIASHEGCSVEWLRGRVGLTQSGTVRLLDRLQSARLVRRSRAGRAVALAISGEGTARLTRWQAARARVVDRLLADLGDGDGDAIVASLAPALERRRRQRPEADIACRTCDWPACADRCPVDRSVAAG
jgi:DNA-binding MarR family transcriptional regulator